MSRQMRWVLAIMLIAVVAGAISFMSLRRHVRRMAQTETSEEQARREVLAPPISTPTDVPVKAQMFWVSPTSADQLAPSEVELLLSADPVQRAKQVLHALIASPSTPAQRTLPAGATLLDFYVLADGTAIADFSDVLSSETPSGILSEQMAVDSIARTLESNVPSLRRLKILIHGQEAETLAGHIDLTGYFDLHPAVAPASTPSRAGASGLTGSTAPGKLKP